MICDDENKTFWYMKNGTVTLLQYLNTGMAKAICNVTRRK